MGDFSLARIAIVARMVKSQIPLRFHSFAVGLATNHIEHSSFRDRHLRKTHRGSRRSFPKLRLGSHPNTHMPALKSLHTTLGRRPESRPVGCRADHPCRIDGFAKNLAGHADHHSRTVSRPSAGVLTSPASDGPTRDGGRLAT